MSYTIRDTPTLADNFTAPLLRIAEELGFQDHDSVAPPALALDVRPEPADIKPLVVFDAAASRAAALAALRDRLGREPTADDIETEKARERAEYPMHVGTMPGHVETLPISIGFSGTKKTTAPSGAKKEEQSK